MDALKPKRSYTKKINCTECGILALHKYTSLTSKSPSQRAIARTFTDFKCKDCKKVNAKKSRKPVKKSTNVKTEDADIEAVKMVNLEIKEETIEKNQTQKRKRKQIDYDEKCEVNFALL